MKLALSALHTPQPIDGVGVYTANLLKYLADLPCDITTLHYPAFGKPPYSRKTFLPLPLAMLSSFTPLGPWFNSKIEQSIDLFHCTDYRIPRFKKIPVVATLHDAIMLKHPEWDNSTWLSLKNFLKKSSARWADHYITVSHAMISDLVNYWHIDEKKISAVHSGIDDIWFEKISAEKKAAVLQKYNLPQQFILSVGMLQPRKNFARLIQAYQRLPLELQKEYKLMIVGKNGWQTQDLLKTIRHLEEKKVLHWQSSVPLEDLRALYQSATLFAFPSLSEGFGFPVLEAFASGTPVLTSNTSSLPEIAGKAAYFIDPYHLDDISHGLLELLSNRTLREQLIQLGHKRVQQFSWQHCAQQTYKIYQSLL